MPLAVLLWAIISSLSLALAGPQFSTIYLPSFLSNNLPSCAYACIIQFIETSFPTSVCPNQLDQSCLCTSNSRTGFALGEGALKCVASDCTNESNQQLEAAYAICSGIPGAVPMTHDSITATLSLPITVTIDSTVATSSPLKSSTYHIFPMPTSTSSPSSSSIVSSDFVSMPTSGLVTASGSAPSVNPTAHTIPDPLSPSTFSTIFSIAPSSAPIPTTTSSNAPQPTNVLSKGQLAGVAVSASVTSLVVFGLIAFCCRKRKKQGNKQPRDSIASFGDTQEAPESVQPRQNPPTSIVAALDRSDHDTPAAGPQVSKVQQVLGGPFPLNQQRPSPTRQRTPVEDTGLAVTPGMRRENVVEESPISPASYRTTSKLLPDKPTYSLYPLSSSSPPRVSPNGVENVAIRPPEDISIPLRNPDRLMNAPRQNWRPMDTSQTALQGRSQAQDSRDPFIDASRFPRTQQPRDGNMNFPIYGNSWAQAGRLPHPQQKQEPSQLSMSRPGALQPDPPSQALNTGSYPSRRYPTKPEVSAQMQVPRRDSYSRRTRRAWPETYLRPGSETSFEDDGGDDVGNDAEPESALSPVAESPVKRLPLSEIRYPTINRGPSPPTPTRKPVTRTRPNLPAQNQPTQNPPTQNLPLRSPPMQNLPLRNPPIQIIDVSPNRALPPQPLFRDRVTPPANRTDSQASIAVPTRPFGPRPYQMNVSPNPKLSAKQQILLHPSMESLETSKPSGTSSRGARIPLGGRLPNGERLPIAGTMRGGEKTPVTAKAPSLMGRRPQGATARY